MTSSVEVPNEERFTDDGTKVFCFYRDPHDVKTTDIVLCDNVGRFKRITVRGSTGLVILPLPEFGEILFEPTGERDSRNDNRFVFRPRPVMIVQEVENMVKKMISRPRITGAGTIRQFPRM